MQRVEGGYILKDTQSTNGIKHDDVLMDIIDLFDGMEVLVGDVPLKFILSDEELDTLGEEEFSSHERKKLPPMNEEAIEEEEPQHSTSSPRHSQDSSKKGNDALKSLIVLLLIIVAIAIGMTLRHFKETGDLLPAKFIQSE